MVQLKISNRVLLVAKSGLALAIVLGVSIQFYRILSQLDFDRFPIAIRIELLVPAGLLYLLAQVCWGTFWVRLLKSEGVDVTWYAGLRTYSSVSSASTSRGK